MLNISKNIPDGKKKTNSGGDNMIKHFIILASAYSLGTRIALDYYDEEILQMDVIKKDLGYIIDKLGEDVPISTHYIQTKQIGWKEVEKQDKFFRKTRLIKTKEEFIELLLKDRTLKGIDIAKYILTKIPCTHLKLEKLVYLCYADYLCKEKKKLFDDKIYAYRLGSVIESVYEKYKKSGYDLVEDDRKTEDESKKRLPIRSRIIASEEGLKKILSIDKTLEKYGKYSAHQLVDITHNSYSPWSQAGAGVTQYEEISDELILKFHKYESI